MCRPRNKYRKYKKVRKYNNDGVVVLPDGTYQYALYSIKQTETPVFSPEKTRAVTISDIEFADIRDDYYELSQEMLPKIYKCRRFKCYFSLMLIICAYDIIIKIMQTIDYIISNERYKYIFSIYYILVGSFVIIGLVKSKYNYCLLYTATQYMLMLYYLYISLILANYDSIQNYDSTILVDDIINITSKNNVNNMTNITYITYIDNVNNINDMNNILYDTNMKILLQLFKLAYCSLILLAIKNYNNLNLEIDNILNNYNTRNALLNLNN